MFIRKIDDWEQRKLGEVTESFDGKRVPIDSGLRVLGEYPYYGATGIIDYVDDYIFDGEYVLLAEDGANIIMRNNPVAYLTQGKFWLNNHAHIMRIIEGNNYFLVQVLEKIDYIKYNTGTAQPKLNSKIVKNIEFKLPQIEEQQKIGAFFKQLDDTIALHQRKLDALKLMKKGFLQQMFPEKGEKVPKLRFADFEEEWQQRKLEEVLKVNSGRDYKHLKSGDIPVYGTGGYMLSVDDKLSNVDGVGIGRKGTIDKPQYLKAPYWTVDTLFYMTVFEGNDIRFLYSLTKNINWKKMDESTGVPSLSKSAIKKVVKTFPPFEEQQKIGIFFKQLDDVIVFYQNKLNTLNNLKKSFLQNMFI
ncbi:restriction endonuclease subunit S [Listeria seeligeri]|uniref:restriction endonuclease subunit S n=1 Tax=Listeria seeligeri TaxID=1640 RepID=UPI002FDB9A7F